LAVTVIGNVPVGVAADVAIASVLVQAGVQLGALKVAVAPPGKPDAAKATLCAVPLTSVALITLPPPAPRISEMPPDEDSA
jgi:hypothetical protein